MGGCNVDAGPSPLDELFRVAKGANPRADGGRPPSWMGTRCSPLSKSWGRHALPLQVSWSPASRNWRLLPSFPGQTAAALPTVRVLAWSCVRNAGGVFCRIKRQPQP